MKYDYYRIMPLSEECSFYFKTVSDDYTTDIYLVRREGDEVKGSILLWCGKLMTRKQVRDIICRWTAYMNDQRWVWEKEDER